MAIALIAAFIINLIGISHITHLSAQDRLFAEFQDQLAAGTAPVSEGDADDVLLADSAPVAIIDIPKIGLYEVVGEGTTSGVLMGGPGHRRDTVLPGQGGVSVLMGRESAYGGPFSRLEELAPGDSFAVRTGQGEFFFEVMGVRYAGDPSPPRPVAGESRLILETARGLPYAPSGIARVDARMTSDAAPSGARSTTTARLLPAERSLGIDTSTVWALVFALQFLVIAELAAVWSFRRLGARKTWVVFLPILTLAALLTMDQINRLLPNLL